MTEGIREIVVPGDVLDDSGKLKPGFNVYRDGERIFATRLGVKSVRGDRVSVISLSGRYEPQRGDMVVGTVVEVGPSNWYITVGAAHDVGLHVNDVPWRVEFGETSKYLAVGDTVLLKIAHVDEMGKVQVSMKDRQCRKLTGGMVVEVAPVKVPRVIGRSGSMIQMIKDMTGVRLFAGQNGVIWMDGEPEDLNLALEAIRKVEAEAHTRGLTDAVRGLLEERTGRSYEDVKRELAELHQTGELPDEEEDAEEPEVPEAEETEVEAEPEAEEEEDEEEDAEAAPRRKRGGRRGRTRDAEDAEDDEKKPRRRRGRRGGRRKRGGSNEGGNGSADE